MREHLSSFPEFDPSDGSSFKEWSEESFGYVEDGTVYGGIEPGDPRQSIHGKDPKTD